MATLWQICRAPAASVGVVRTVRSAPPLDGGVRARRQFDGGRRAACHRFVEGPWLDPPRCIEAVARLQIIAGRTWAEISRAGGVPAQWISTVRAFCRSRFKTNSDHLPVCIEAVAAASM